MAESKDAIDRQMREDEKTRGREETGNISDKKEQILKTPKTNTNISRGTKSKLAKTGAL